MLAENETMNYNGGFIITHRPIADSIYNRHRYKHSNEIIINAKNTYAILLGIMPQQYVIS